MPPTEQLPRAAPPGPAGRRLVTGATLGAGDPFSPGTRVVETGIDGVRVWPAP